MAARCGTFRCIGVTEVLCQSCQKNDVLEAWHTGDGELMCTSCFE